MPIRTIAFASALVASVAFLLVGTLSAQAQPDPYDVARRAASDSGLTLGPIPDGELRVDALPDLLPVGEGDVIWGYAYARDVFADSLDPNLDVLAYGVYEADGETLLGHVIPGKGFVPGADPIPLTRTAPVPKDAEAPLAE